MPNWCTNFLTIKGDVKGFIQANKGKVARYKMTEDELKFYSDKDIEESKAYYGFTFNALVPVPEDVLEAGYQKEGYNWQINNWGTKWDLNDKDIQPASDADSEEYTVIFDTAWGPPIQWLVAAAAAYPSVTLELTYHEMGMLFCGRTLVESGIVLEETQYSGDNDELWTFMDSYFDMFREEVYGEEEEEDDNE